MQESPCIPILMYHSISNENDSATHPYYLTNTFPEVFAEQMSYLYKHNYSTVSVSEVPEILAGGGNIKRKYVAITFDDGFRDFYTNAFPILQEYGFTATVFLPTGFISNDHSTFKERECLNWAEVKELHGKRIIFGSHTVNHLQLHNLNVIEILNEINESKQAIEAKIGRCVETFSYPYAFPDADDKFKLFLISALEKTNYKFGVTTRIGTSSKGDNKFLLKRIPVNSNDDRCMFKAKLDGCYDWMQMPQYLYKRVKYMMAVYNKHSEYGKLLLSNRYNR